MNFFLFMPALEPVTVGIIGFDIILISNDTIIISDKLQSFLD